jgi:hypothetical protein
MELRALRIECLRLNAEISSATTHRPSAFISDINMAGVHKGENQFLVRDGGGVFLT